MAHTASDPGFPSGTQERDIRLHSGLNMRVYEAGPPDAPPVLFLHGFPELALSWRFQFAELADSFRVIAPDLRGYGHTDAPTERAAYRLDVLTRDVTELLDALKIERVHLVGHDWGAAIGWEVAQRYPTRLLSYSALNGPPVPLMSREIWRPRQIAKSWYIFYFQLPWFPERRFLRDPESYVKRAFHSGTNKAPFTDEALRPYAESLRRTKVAAINYYRAGLGEIGSKMRNVSVPCQILWGVDDRFLGSTFADPDTYAPYVDELRITKIEAAGHWVQQEAPDAVNAALRDFFDRQRK